MDMLLKPSLNIVKKSRRSYHITFGVIALFLALSPFIIEGTSLVQFLGKCMCYAMVGIALDLIWGYTGMLSLGHGLWFCLGGYAMAMYLKLDGNGGKITDFMQTGGLTELPWFWEPFGSFPLTLILIILIPAVFAGLIGFFVFRSRIKGVYFSIITQALTWAVYSLFMANSKFTGGNNGITAIDSLFGKTKGSANRPNLLILFFVTLTVLVLVYIAATYLTGRKFGKLLIAIRDGENRTYFSGYSVNSYKNFIYAVSAVLSAIAGAFFVNFNGSITPTQMTIGYSITMVIWVAVGGRGTIIGAVIGAFFINLCEYNFSSGILVEAWQYIIGAIFCLTILLFKGGIVGIAHDNIPQLIKRLKNRNAAKKKEAA
jgi:urea transport system permease protein